jgi:hypothetical protein
VARCVARGIRRGVLVSRAYIMFNRSLFFFFFLDPIYIPLKSSDKVRSLVSTLHEKLMVTGRFGVA